MKSKKTCKGRTRGDGVALLLYGSSTLLFGVLNAFSPHTHITLDVIDASRYFRSMIRSFATKETAAIFDGLVVRRLPLDMQQTARRKLKQLDVALIVDELRIPPGNRLESLKGDRKGQWSIRINNQWRICFCWEDGDALDVEIVDYH